MNHWTIKINLEKSNKTKTTFTLRTNWWHFRLCLFTKQIITALAELFKYQNSNVLNYNSIDKKLSKFFIFYSFYSPF